ncbi:hypothetical protein MAP00_007926 [Monascus purpureus]|nr:hypothetical protein MAP00_007926 [Monascus purpureus]
MSSFLYPSSGPGYFIISDILTALDSLSAGNEEEIAQYREHTLLATRSRNIPLSADTSTGDALSSSKRLGAIERYAKQPHRDAVGEASYKKEKRRIVDVDDDEPKETELKIRFRALLEIRSFGLAFRKFQRKERNEARADTQVNHLLSSADKFKIGRMKDFIESEDYIIDKATTRKMIHEGTKLIVLEGLYGHCGISAVFWITPSWVRLSYQDFPTFLELLLQDPEYAPVKTAMEELADWFEDCYELCYPSEEDSPSEDKFNQQPQIVETRKRRSAQPLESAKPFKARCLTIQRDDPLVKFDGATRDNHRQEVTRPKDFAPASLIEWAVTTRAPAI